MLHYEQRECNTQSKIEENLNIALNQQFYYIQVLYCIANIATKFISHIFHHCIIATLQHLLKHGTIITLQLHNNKVTDKIQSNLG